MIKFNEVWDGLKLKRSGFISSLNRRYSFVVDFQEIENKIVSAFDYLLRVGYTHNNKYDYSFKSDDDASRLFTVTGYDYRFCLSKNNTHIIFTIAINDGYFGSMDISVISSNKYRKILFYSMSLDNIDNRIEVASFEFAHRDLENYGIEDKIEKIGNRPEMKLFPRRFTCLVCFKGKCEIMKPNKKTKCRECKSRFKCDSNGHISLM